MTMLIGYALALLPTGEIARFDFERGQGLWQNLAEDLLPVEAAWSPDEGRNGGGCLHTRSDGLPGGVNVTWRADLPPAAPNLAVRVRAWVRGVGVEETVAVLFQAVSPDGADLMERASSLNTQPLKGDFEWQQIEVTMLPPRGRYDLQLLLTLVGDGEVWLDDVVVEAVPYKAPAFQSQGRAGLYEVTVTCTWPARQTAAPCLLTLPRSRDDQAVLSLTLDDAVDWQGIQDSPGRWIAAGLVEPQAETLVWSALILVGPEDESMRPTRAAFPTTLPDELRRYTYGTRLVPVPAPNSSFAGDVVAVIRQAGSRSPLGAVSTMRRWGVPARIGLGMVAEDPEPRAFAEAFVPGFGWMPRETPPPVVLWWLTPGDENTAKQFPPRVIEMPMVESCSVEASMDKVAGLYGSATQWRVALGLAAQRHEAASCDVMSLRSLEWSFERKDQPVSNLVELLVEEVDSGFTSP